MTTENTYVSITALPLATDMEFIEIVSDIFDIEHYAELGEEGYPQIIYGIKK